MTKEDSLVLSSHHLEHLLSICSVFWERVNWGIASLVLFLCGLFEITRGAKVPQPSALFPSLLDGPTAIWYGSFGKLWEGSKETFVLDWCSLCPCCSVLSELVRNVFFYLSIISSGPDNCLEWKVLAGKATLQQIGLFERQWHFKIDVLKLPHALLEKKKKKKEGKGWYFTETCQKQRGEVLCQTSLSCVCFCFASPFHIATFQPLWDEFGVFHPFYFPLFFLFSDFWDLPRTPFFPNPDFQLMFQENLGSS